jgi:hypothetical protein
MFVLALVYLIDCELHTALWTAHSTVPPEEIIVSQVVSKSPNFMWLVGLLNIIILYYIFLWTTSYKWSLSFIFPFKVRFAFFLCRMRHILRLWNIPWLVILITSDKKQI